MDSAVDGKRCTILGAARSGLAAAALLRRHGATVFVSDRAPAEAMKAAKQELDGLGIEMEFGANSERALNADLMVLSPGIPSSAPIVQAALGNGVPVISEMELASWFCKGTIVAISGTNGKTTTTTLAGEIFKAAGRDTVVAGNIGLAFSDVVERVNDGTAVVLEVSSFQLDHCQDFKPRVSVLLNITPDHLDRYGNSFERYSDSKTKLFRNQTEGDILIYNADDPEVMRQATLKAPPGVSLLPFSTRQPLNEGAFVKDDRLMAVLHGHSLDVVPVAAIGIPGIHNLQNAMAASLAALALGVPSGVVQSTLRDFKGVEHRLEFVREFDGVRYVNDSKGTNVDSVWYALQSFDTPIVLMLGGRDKGNDYSRLYDLVDKHVRAIVAIGESAPKVMTAFAGRLPLKAATSMEEAVALCRSLARPGDVVLLSPACASFDWFDNYEHRGQVFRDIVRTLRSKT